ncbi:MAG: 60 kDa chaperonin [Chlamydiae bacterium]|nr:60 kDa chaperonin [Chlamydiota bacterium]
MSTPKEIIFEEEAREKLLSGIAQLDDVVSFTLGPKGRNVGFEKSWGPPTITNDGNSIVNEIELDGFENLGVSIAKEMAQKIKEKAGDGTTSGILLLRALVEAGIKNIASGASPILVKRGMDKAVEAVIASIDKMAKHVKTQDEIRNIATVSASGNTEIGQLISDAMEKVGKEGVITIEEAKGIDTTIEVVEGMQFDRGYCSPYFCTNVEKMIADMQNAQLLLVDRKISNVHELLPILQASASTGRELLIIAEDIEGDVLSTLVVNRLRGTLKAAAVKAPGFGDKRKAMLQDIATLTGATVVSEETGISLKEATTEILGHAERVIITNNSTTIISQGQETAVKARVKQIENEIQEATSKYDKEKLEERKAKLSGGVAIVRIGAATEPEMKQKKQDAEDSLNSTRAAVQEGIVPGGGVALLRASQELEKLKLEGDEELGAHIVIKACRAPLRQIAHNSGEDGSVILAEVLESEFNIGYNANTGKKEDLMKAGIIDPAKVVKSELIHAASAAGITLISEALVIDAEDED